MIQFTEKYFKELLIAFGVLAIGVLGYSALREHDARILAEQTVHESQGRVAVLEKQSQDVVQAGAVQIAKLQKEAKAVKTPAQAIEAIKAPDFSDIQLNPSPLPDAPDKVAVDAVPLFKELNKCEQCSSSLATATAELDLEKKVEAEKDVQITALKKKPSFWHRVEKTAEVLAIGGAIGYAAHR